MVVDGRVVGIIIENKGTGYTTINLQIVGAGTGATAVAYVGESDFVSDQSVVEQSAVPGAIYAVKITQGGGAYTAPTVTITGDGTGATAVAKILSGRVNSIEITSKGTDYSIANIRLVGGDGTGATAIANLDAKLGTLRLVYYKDNGHNSSRINSTRFWCICTTSRLRSTRISSTSSWLCSLVIY